jgi:hypothetical protein
MSNKDFKCCLKYSEQFDVNFVYMLVMECDHSMWFEV